MKTPRDVSGRDLVKALHRLGYTVDHQAGSHIRLAKRNGGELHLTIPDHNPIKIGTFNANPRDVAEHAGITREQLLKLLSL